MWIGSMLFAYGDPLVVIHTDTDKGDFPKYIFLWETSQESERNESLPLYSPQVETKKAVLH